MNPFTIGIVGCGNISSIYLRNLQAFGRTRVKAVSDLNMESAQQRASEFAIPIACSVDELLDDSEIGIVLNLTVPLVHFEIAKRAIEAGKHVYNEKPLALETREGEQLLSIALGSGVRVGCAPDTFLGAGLQTCRELIDRGDIGEPIGAQAFMMCHGHESWHPSPEFYYQRGGGPLFDMGPYYLTALVSLLGPIGRVSGAARITSTQRTITSEPKRGQKIAVETPTHISALLDFNAGAIGQITTSFDVWHHKCPCLEVYGTEGSLSVPDPNGFDGPVQLRKSTDDEWHDVPVTRPFAGNSRGLGVLEMADAIEANRPHRASGDLACHVLEAMEAVLQSSAGERSIKMKSVPIQPLPLESTMFAYEAASANL